MHKRRRCLAYTYFVRRNDRSLCEDQIQGNVYSVEPFFAYFYADYDYSVRVQQVFAFKNNNEQLGRFYFVFQKSVYDF